MPSRRNSKLVYSEEELLGARTHVESWWEPSHYSFEDEDHPSDEEVKESWVRKHVRRSRRRAKYAHMRRECGVYQPIEHLFKSADILLGISSLYRC